VSSIETKEKDAIYIHQPKLLKHLEEDFGQHVTTNSIFLTSGARKTVIMQPDKDDPLIPPYEQTIYRSVVGMLLYLVKKLKTRLVQCSLRLTKVLDGATPVHWKALICIVKHKVVGIEVATKVQFRKAFFPRRLSDSESAGGRETRASVYGYITFFCGAPISWKSKSNKSVTLSLTEAE
jgi:hypothetical protein